MGESRRSAPRRRKGPPRPNFGDDLRLHEDTREMCGWTWLDRLHQDLTYGARVLRNARGFTLTAMR